MLGLNSGYNTVSTTVDMINGKHIFSLGEGLFASSPLPSFVFSAAQKKISYSNHMETFLSNFFLLLLLVYCRVHILWMKQAGAVFPSFLSLSEVGGVQLSVSSPAVYFVSRENILLNELWTVGNIFYLSWSAHHLPPHNWDLFASQ